MILKGLKFLLLFLVLVTCVVTITSIFNNYQPVKENIDPEQHLDELKEDLLEKELEKDKIENLILSFNFFSFVLNNKNLVFSYLLSLSEFESKEIPLPPPDSV